MDGLRWFQLVAPVRESLRDNQIQPLPDWGVKWGELPDVQPCILHVDRRPLGGGVGGRREHADASVGVVVATKRKRARITLYCGRRVFTADDRELTGIARFPPEPRYSQPRCCTTKTSNRWSYHYLRLIIRWSRFGAAAHPTKCARPPRPAEAGADVLS